MRVWAKHLALSEYRPGAGKMKYRAKREGVGESGGLRYTRVCWATSSFRDQKVGTSGKMMNQGGVFLKQKLKVAGSGGERNTYIWPSRCLNIQDIPWYSDGFSVCVGSPSRSNLTQAVTCSGTHVVELPATDLDLEVRLLVPGYYPLQHGPFHHHALSAI